MLARRHRVRVGLCLLACSAILSCRSDDPVEPSDSPPAPALAISDGQFNHGNPRFFWLPPLVPNPASTGEPDGTLKPHVLICQWRDDVDRCGTVVADFSTAAGTGSQTVRYDATSGQYLVNWDTKMCLSGACTLDPGKIYRIRVFVGQSQLGFADVDPAESGKQVQNLASDDYITLVNGRTLPIKFRIAKGAVAVIAAGSSAPIGTAGGTVTLGEAATLDIPSGALGAATGISIAPADNPPAGLIADLAPVVDLGPDGTQFSKPVTLTLPFDPSKLPAGVPPSAAAIYTAAGGGWELVPGSVVDDAKGTVTAPINHFSTYTIMIQATSVTGASTATALTVGDSTTVTSQAYVYDVQTGTYCYQVPTFISSGWFGGYVVVETRCINWSTPYKYPLQNVAVSWFHSNPAVASVALGPTLTNAAGVATSPQIHGVAEGEGVIYAATNGVSSSILITVKPATAAKLVVMSLKGSRPEAPKFDVWIMNPDGSGARALAPTLDDLEEYPDLSWDGKTVIFGSTRTGAWEIFRIKPDGTGLTQVTALGATTRAPRLSPDGSRILFYSTVQGSADLYTVATASTMVGFGAVQRITSDPGDEVLPDWSPDGRRIVYSSNRTGTLQVYTRDLATGYERQLTFDAGNHQQARWEPRGRRITYANDLTRTLWIVDADDGRPPVELTPPGATDHAPAWSADGKSVLFASNRSSGSYYQVHAINLATRAITHYLSTPDETLPMSWRDPSITPPTPPTEVVAVISTRGSRPLSPKNDVFLMNPDGSNLRALSPTLDDQEEYVDLSRDRSTVVFGSTRSGSFQIFRIGADGKNLSQVTNMGSFTRGPRLSPDGTRILFHSDAAGGNRIYSVSATAQMATLAQAQQITAGPNDFLPDWSPDGSRIVFSSSRDGVSQLYVKDLATGVERRITSDAGDHLNARWAPSGTRIAYLNAASRTVWSVDAEDGAAPIQLTQPGPPDGEPGWSPDGQHLLFASARAGLAWFQLFMVNADGSGLERVSDTQEDIGGPTWR